MEDALISAAAQIRQGMPAADQIAFMHAVLSQIGLPRSEVDGLSFERSSGGASLLIEAGKIWDGQQWVQQPVPYGPKPRIILADICTTALRNRSRVIHLGSSMTEYLKRLGWTDQGGPRGPLTAFQKQVKALAVCRISLGVAYSDRATQVSGQPVEGFESWLDTSRKHRIQWPKTIYLTEKFWKSLQVHAVPIDMRAIMALRDSALALDLYTWLAYRLYQLDKPMLLPWKALRVQFGQEYNDASNFKREVLRLLGPVLAVYPDAKVDSVDGGLQLSPSRPPISPRISVPGKPIAGQV